MINFLVEDENLKIQTILSSSKASIFNETMLYAVVCQLYL